MKIYDTEGDLKILAVSHQTLFFGACKECGLFTLSQPWSAKNNT